MSMNFTDNRTGLQWNIKKNGEVEGSIDLSVTCLEDGRTTRLECIPAWILAMAAFAVGNGPSENEKEACCDD